VPPQLPSTQDTYPANQPGGPILNGRPQDQKPLTPEEIRRREIDKYNPLNPVSPTKTALPGDPASATSQAPADTPASQKPVQPQEAPIPGSVADSAQHSPIAPPADGPTVVSTGDDPSVDQRPFNGPAVLSRSYTISRPIDSRAVKWVWSVGSSEFWQAGIVTGAGTSAVATNGNSFGTTTTFSLAGRHLWKKDQLGLNYTGSYSRYFSSAGYDGTNQALNLDYEHYFSRHLSLNVVESGSILSQNATLQNPLSAPGVSVANISLAESPTNQVLDQTTRQSFSNVGVTWQQSARLSLSLSEGFFVVERTGIGLVGTTGYQSQADINYRWSHATTVGVYYSYSDYLYTKHVSDSDTHSAGLIYSYALNRRTQLRLRGGIARIETLGLTLVPIDPIFAVLVGASAGYVDAYSRRYTTDISAQFVRDFGRKRSANVSYAHGIAPGNGLILTGAFATTIFRSYLLNFSGGRSQLSSQVQSVGTYTSNFIGISLAHTIPKGPSANFGVNYRTYVITGMPGLQRQFTVSTGLTWSPGPGRLW
jgi:hypothetical protein